MEHLTIQERGDVVMVTFKQARILDEHTIRAIGSEFGNLTLEAAADHKLLVNFAGVEYMSSAMLGQIVRLNKQCKNDSIKLKLCSICAQVMEVFTITKLNKVMDIEKDEESALAAFSGAPAKKGWFGR